MKIVPFLVVTVTLSLPFVVPAQAQTCPFKTGKFQGDWPYIGQMELRVESVDASCTSAAAAYSQPGKIAPAQVRQIVDGELIIACARQGTCKFKPIGDGAALKASYFDVAGKQTNASTFEIKK